MSNSVLESVEKVSLLVFRQHIPAKTLHESKKERKRREKRDLRVQKVILGINNSGYKQKTKKSCRRRMGILRGRGKVARQKERVVHETEDGKTDEIRETKRKVRNRRVERERGRR